jgi:predicted phosphodiesterase
MSSPPQTSNSRIALLADIHGNSIALDCVLQDIEARGGVDEYWFLGDHVAIGHDPVGVLERITALKNAKFIRGNTDRLTTDFDQRWPLEENAGESTDLLLRNTRVARSFAWTTGAVAVTGWLPWLSQLPLDIRRTLTDGTRVLAVYASPGTDDGFGIHIMMSDQEVEETIRGCEADLIFVGHTHFPFDRRVDGVRVINPGSVSNPLPPDLRACYVILTANEDGYEIEFRRVEFDREAVIQAVKEVHQPSWEYIASFMEGRRKPDWMKE